MNSRSTELAALERESQTIRFELQSMQTDDKVLYSATDVERRQQLDQRLVDITPQIAQLRSQWTAQTDAIRKLQVEKSELDKKRNGYIGQQRRLMALRGDNGALLTQNTDATSVGDELATTNALIRTVREALREKDDELAKINMSEVREHVVTPEHIADTYSELSGIPTGQLNEDEREPTNERDRQATNRSLGVKLHN